MKTLKVVLMKKTPSFIRVVETDDRLSHLSAKDFIVDGLKSPLALAFISPHVAFDQVTATLQQLAGTTPVVAVSTGGEFVLAPRRGLYTNPLALHGKAL